MKFCCFFLGIFALPLQVVFATTLRSLITRDCPGVDLHRFAPGNFSEARHFPKTYNGLCFGYCIIEEAAFIHHREGIDTKNPVYRDEVFDRMKEVISVSPIIEGSPEKIMQLQMAAAFAATNRLLNLAGLKTSEAIYVNFQTFAERATKSRQDDVLLVANLFPYDAENRLDVSGHSLILESYDTRSGKAVVRDPASPARSYSLMLDERGFVAELPETLIVLYKEFEPDALRLRVESVFWFRTTKLKQLEARADFDVFAGDRELLTGELVALSQPGIDKKIKRFIERLNCKDSICDYWVSETLRYRFDRAILKSLVENLSRKIDESAKKGASTFYYNGLSVPTARVAAEVGVVKRFLKI